MMQLSLTTIHSAIVLGLALVGAGTASRAAPVVHEILASGSSEGFRDEDGEVADWIEIYNPDDVSVDLGGYYLSDDPDALAKWQFPDSVSLPAQQYLVVFASGKDRAVASRELHTSFSLATQGEGVYLTAPDGRSVVSSIENYPEQQSDVSYGRGVTGATFGMVCWHWIPSSSRSI